MLASVMLVLLLRVLLLTLLFPMLLLSVLLESRGAGPRPPATQQPPKRAFAPLGGGVLDYWGFVGTQSGCYRVL